MCEKNTAPAAVGQAAEEKRLGLLGGPSLVERLSGFHLQVPLVLTLETVSSPSTFHSLVIPRVTGSSTCRSFVLPRFRFFTAYSRVSVDYVVK